LLLIKPVYSFFQQYIFSISFDHWIFVVPSQLAHKVAGQILSWLNSGEIYWVAREYVIAFFPRLIVYASLNFRNLHYLVGIRLAMDATSSIEQPVDSAFIQGKRSIFPC